MRTPSVPRYHEIELALRARIATMRAHDPIPSEPELSAEFSVSRMTARAAVERLLADELVYRVRGRGTFVAEPRAHRRVENLTAFSTQMARQGRVATSRTLRAVARTGTPGETRGLRLADGSDVVEIVRVRLADRRPVALETAVLPGALRPVLEVDLESGSLHDALRALGRVPTRGTCVIRAENADAAAASALGIDEGAALLREERVVHDERGEPLELTTSRYSGTAYALDAVFEVTGQAARPPGGPPDRA